MAAYVDKKNLVDVLKKVLAIKGNSFAPDYAKMEASNRITALGGSWTVDRDGYVHLFRVKGGGAWDGNSLYFTINGVGATSTTPSNTMDILPVKKGDIVSLQGDISASAVSCKYIPPLSGPGGGNGVPTLKKLAGTITFNMAESKAVEIPTGFDAAMMHTIRVISENGNVSAELGSDSDFSRILYASKEDSATVYDILNLPIPGSTIYLRLTCSASGTSEAQYEILITNLNYTADESVEEEDV